jgi:hypothetical protein
LNKISYSYFLVSSSKNISKNLLIFSAKIEYDHGVDANAYLDLQKSDNKKMGKPELREIQFYNCVNMSFFALLLIPKS